MATTFKLARRFAAAGVVVGIVFLAMYSFDYKYNPFHMPTSSQTDTLPGPYSAPPLYSFLEKVMFVLVPGLWLQVLTIDTGDRVAWVMWFFAVLLNAPIYYFLGLASSAVWKRFELLRGRS